MKSLLMKWRGQLAGGEAQAGARPRKLSSATRRALYRQCSAQLTNGVGLLACLEDFRERLQRRGRRSQAGAVEAVLRGLRDGRPLYVALGASIGPAERAILKAGEESGGKAGEESGGKARKESGGLVEAMNLVLEAQERESRINLIMAGSLFSPAVYALALWACLYIIGAYVTGDFLQVLPLERWTGWAYVMYCMGEVAKGKTGIVILVLLAAYAGFAAWGRHRWTGKGRAAADQWIFPFNLFRELDGFIWMATYAALLRSGVQDRNALQTQIGIGSEYWRSRLTPVLMRLKNGISLADALRATKHRFPSDDAIDEIAAYSGFDDFPDKLWIVAKEYAANMEKTLTARVFIISMVFSGLMFVAMGVVQLGVNELQAALMSATGRM